MNPKFNGQIQHDWDWLIAVYLFLGGLGSGAYAIAAFSSFFGSRYELITSVGLWIGFPALLIGSFFLIADLGAPSRAMLAGLKPKTSWIARGFWIISIFMVLAFLHLVLYTFTNSTGVLLQVIAVAGIIFALGTMAYTGMLLGASKGVPFWRSSAEPVVFVFSALITGLFAIMLGMGLFSPSAAAIFTLRSMAGVAVILLAIELIAVLFFIHGAHHHPDSKESAERILRNNMFIVGVLILGIMVPLILMLSMSFSSAGSGNSVAAMAVLGSILGLLGGLLLRRSVLISGILPTWNMAGFEFRRIHRPKVPKPGIGLMPPGNEVR